MTSPTLTFNGRLPGVACTPVLPPSVQPIRLDIPAFVGLCERGPVNLPTPLEDINAFQLLFGADLVVAQDGGLPVYANLPATVRSFFDNGGLRCYVVRVAGPNAVAARWLLPGMRCYLPDGTVDDVFVQAAWPGAWSDGMEVGTQLLEQPLTVDGPYVPGTGGASGQLTVRTASALQLVSGDLVRLDLGPLLPGVYLSVGTVGPSGPGGVAQVTAAGQVPFMASVASPPADLLASAVTLLEPDAMASLPPSVPVVGAKLLRLDLVIQQLPSAGGSAQQLEQWLNLTFNPPANASATGTAGAAVPTCWLNSLQPTGSAPNLNVSLLLGTDSDTTGLVSPGGAGGIFVPVGMDELGTTAEFVDASLGSIPVPGVVAGDDDLASFDPVALFLDPNLLDETVFDLVDDANQLTVLSSNPIQLKGIHSVIAVDDVAMLSVPDAVLRGWTTVAPVPDPVAPTPLVPVVGTDWSRFGCCQPPVVVAPAPSPPPVTPSYLNAPVLDDLADYDPAPLMAVQAAMVSLCAARADAVAVLSVPSHYLTADYVSWYQQLTSNGQVTGSPLSYAAVWHPWIQIVEPTTPQLAPLRSVPPDGAACGTIAAREAARGVWVAPANMALRGAVALTPALPEADTVTLFNNHDNLLRRQPGAFAALSAHTLSADPALLQVSVRRLLILLRKVALQQGMRYVFETNTDRFRQLVRTCFQRLLTQLTQLGAMVDFRVVTDGSVNTPDDIANGRLIVVLLVAPTNPVEFITVTLVRAGEGLLDVLAS